MATNNFLLQEYGMFVRGHQLAGLAGLLTGILLLAGGNFVLQAQTSVTLAWDPSSDPDVTGYRLYEGGVSQVYTNTIDTGKATTVTVSGLVPGATYFFAVTAYTSIGLESPFSPQIAYTAAVPTRPKLALLLQSAKQAVLTGTGPAGYRYDILAGQGLTNWVVIGGVTNDASGAFRFTDPASATNKVRCYRLRQSSP